MMNEQVKHMVDRFLAWRLPENFRPDGGITFKAEFNEHTPFPMRHEPRGTNLLDAAQAEAMVRYIIAGMPTDAGRAVTLTPPDPTGEEFLEFKEVLSDLRALRHEHDCLNGGGPGWSARNKAAWDKADELFANEDEAAYDRQQESFYG